MAINADVLFPRFLLLLISVLVIQLCAFSAPEDIDNVYGRRLLTGSDEVACSALCPSSWIMNQNKTKCFKYMGRFKSWDESEASCKHYDGHLASLATFQDLNLAHQLCNKSIGGCWVGGRSKITTFGPVWNWSDNSSYYNDSIFPALNSSSNYTSNMSNLCTLFKYGLQTMVPERCSKGHTYVCALNTGSDCYHRRRYREYFIILAVVSGLIICTTSVVVVWLLVFKRSKRRRRSKKLPNSASSALVPPSWRVFTSEELRSITKCFSEGNRLPGDVKTGSTYRGVLPDGSKVAVKRLKSSGYQRKKEFYSEVGRVARLHHPSLVAVKGCCYDHGDRYIVYEYIVNGSLDRWLHHVPRGGRCLNWSMRMKIGTTLAQGIAFFHDKVKPQVVHRDIRASNVLLDEEFGAHLMGVGLSKFVPWEAMQEKTVMAGGSHGYLAPEFVYRNELTTKSDVYSFGVLLLEIVTGRRPAQRALDSSVGWQSIFEWATPLVQANRYMELLDPQMSTASSSSTGNSPEVGVVQKVVDLVYACTQNVPSMRPRMSHVVHQLQQLTPSSPAVV